MILRYEGVGAVLRLRMVIEMCIPWFVLSYPTPMCAVGELDRSQLTHQALFLELNDSNE